MEAKVSKRASGVECESALALAFVVFPHCPDNQRAGCLIDKVRTMLLITSHGNTCGFPPASALWGHWGEEDDLLANQTIKTGALGSTRMAAGRPAACCCCYIPHDLRAPVQWWWWSRQARGPASSAARPAHLVIDYAPYDLLGKFEAPGEREQRHVGYFEI